MDDVLQFTQDQFELAENYRQLHRTTGESYDSMADRMEAQSGDFATAAKIRALAEADPDTPLTLAPPAAVAAVDPPAVAKMTVSDLKDELLAAGQPLTGTKPELQVRVQELRAQTSIPASASDTGGTVTSTQGGDASVGPGTATVGGDAATPAATPAAPDPSAGADTAGAGTGVPAGTVAPTGDTSTGDASTVGTSTGDSAGSSGDSWSTSAGTSSGSSASSGA